MGHKWVKVSEALSAEELRKLARREKNGRVSSRIFALANVLEGMSREAAARHAGMTRQTLCDWVHRYNHEGVAGLKDRAKGRPQRILTPEQEAQFKEIVAKGPELPLVRWRCADLKAVIKERFGVECHERSVGKLLRRLDFVRVSVRPRHPESDPEAQEDFKKTLPPRWPKSCPNKPAESRWSYGFKTKHGSGKRAR